MKVEELINFHQEKLIWILDFTRGCKQGGKK